VTFSPHKPSQDDYPQELTTLLGSINIDAIEYSDKVSMDNLDEQLTKTVTFTMAPTDVNATSAMNTNAVLSTHTKPETIIQQTHSSQPPPRAFVAPLTARSHVEIKSFTHSIGAEDLQAVIWFFYPVIFVSFIIACRYVRRSNKRNSRAIEQMIEEIRQNRDAMERQYRHDKDDNKRSHE
jgi:hypothetical protein